MSLIRVDRRFVLRGLLAAPAIVAASNLMQVRSIARLLRAPKSWYVGGALWPGSYARLSEVLPLVERGDTIFIHGQHFEDTVYLPEGVFTTFDTCKFSSPQGKPYVVSGDRAIFS